MSLMSRVESKEICGIVRTQLLIRGEKGADMYEAKITDKGQITLPKGLREELSIKPGGKVRFIVDGNMAMLIPVGPISELFGNLKYDGPTKTLEDMEQAIDEAIQERIKRNMPR